MLKDYKLHWRNNLNNSLIMPRLMLRAYKDHNTREWKHKVSTSARYYGGVINSDYNKHWKDLK